MKFRNLKISLKLIIGFGFVSAILLAVGIRTYMVLDRLENNKQDIVQATELADNVMEAKFAIRSTQLMLMEMLDSEDPEEIHAIEQEILAYEKAVKEDAENGVKITHDEGWGKAFREHIDEAGDILEEVQEHITKDAFPFIADVVEIKEDKSIDVSKGTEAHEKLEKLDTQIDEACAEAVEHLQETEEVMESEVVDELYIFAAQLRKQSTAELSILIAIGLFLSIVITIGISRGISIPINKGVKFAQKIAEGDLSATIDIDRKDEIGQLAEQLRLTIARWKDIIGQVSVSIANIASASEQLSSNSQEMSQGATEQASNAEEVSSSIEEMAANIQQNTDNAQQTEKISLNAVEGITKVSASSQESITSIREIAEKITIINDIAFQTNILALNAAVEAARAGEHGKGFAVVAAEVRKLAERSKIAADEIEILSKNSVQITEESGSLMDNLIPEIEKTAKLVQEITAASIEQSSGAEQINNAIQQLNSITQQNAASSEEMATSSEELSSQADYLRQVISFFKVDNNAVRASGKGSSDLAGFLKKKDAILLEQEKKNIQETSVQQAEKGVKINLTESASDEDFEAI